MSDTGRPWLILANAKLRANEYRRLTDHFADVGEIIAAGASRLGRAGLPAAKCASIANPDDAHIDCELDWLCDRCHHLVVLGSTAYPELLLQLSDPPLVLYIDGDCDALQQPALAIVGSRNPTDGGRRNARDFARHLGRLGFCIVSGLAEGIDAAAHRGALDAGAKTVAFLGHGIDRVYPAVNRELAHEIATAGALVSEYPLGADPRRYHFPERNRLISGMSLGALVVEAARHSGSLITARLAAEQGREVFALPGSIHNPLARGCHELIRQGAKLVETADDIVTELAPLVGHVLQNAAESIANDTSERIDDSEYVELQKYLSHDPVGVDELAERSGLTIDKVSSMLLILELEGRVDAVSGGRYSLPS
jgi:DNA processing protein